LHLTYHKHITINNASHHTQYTNILCGKPNGRKPHNDFLYIKDCIHRKNQLPNSLAPTGRRLKPPIYRLQPKGSYNSMNSRSNWKEAPTPSFTGSNLKEAPNPFIL
jgi:hypothetical protein